MQLLGVSKVVLFFLEKEKVKKLSPSCQMEKMILILSPSKKLKFMSHLTKEQRYTIFTMLQAKYSKTDIAAAIEKDKSVISRELNRNSDKRTGQYNPDLAQRKYEERKKNKPKFILFTDEIKEMVISDLKSYLSPEQIAGRAKLECKACVSPESIYQFIWADKKRGGTLCKYLRNRGKQYRKRGSKKDTRGILTNRISISERPKIVEEKTGFGDLEIDTVIGKNHKGALLSINDRQNLMQWIVKLSGKNAEELAQKAIEKLIPFKELLHTITSDNGKEFAEHQQIRDGLEIDFYFADPYKSSQRGCNENQNRLIRQFFPKGMDFDEIDNEQVELVQNMLNNRPRKKLGYLTPNEFFELSLQNKKVALVA
jgi:IS30 family transposase